MNLNHIQSDRTTTISEPETGVKKSSVVEVAIPLHLYDCFRYRLPEDLQMAARPGVRLFVPFGRRKLTGYLIGFTEDENSESLKEVLQVLDAEPLWNRQELDFFRWVSNYYIHPLGEVIKAALPAGINLKSRLQGGEEVVSGGRKIKRERLYQATGMAPARPLKGKSAGILELLGSQKQLFASELRKRFGNCSQNLKRLQELGLILFSETEVFRSPFAGSDLPRDSAKQLNQHQQLAVDTITSAAAKGRFAPFLLHGVTGSGKTEVYLQSIARLLADGKNALVLVPEISLTPQLVDRFRGRFNDEIAVLHSALSDGERYDEWRRIRQGRVRIVIGARSAIFAPLEKIGIIVVDEEHEGSFKQSEGLRYNARDLALVRGQSCNAVVLLGSATPLITSVYAARTGRLGYLTLPERVAGRSLPHTEIITSRITAEKPFSEELTEAIGKNLKQGEQTVLFLNRRGFASWLACPCCGADLQCPNCSVSLTYHRQRGRSICHYCDYQLPAPCICPNCGETDLKEMGVGTERIEYELVKLFPDARIARMDSDTVAGKGGHARILEQVRRGEVDILVGTQMIAKGHDFPGVTLVGVLQSEASLYLPDFRAAERTFQLLCQVIGRSGRGEQAGRVLLQSGNPEHYSIQLAANHDFERFYLQELEYRKELGYPPFGHLAALLFSSTSEAELEKGAKQVADRLRGIRGNGRLRVEILGPAAVPLYKVRGRYRMQILLKGEGRAAIRQLLLALCKDGKISALVRMAMDLDPVDLL